MRKIAILGGSGGIGIELVKQCLNRFSKVEVFATYHRHPPEFHHSRLRWCRLDATRETHYAALADAIDNFDWLLNAIGFLHNNAKGPEKSLKHFDTEFFLQNIHVNTLPSILAAKHLGAGLKHSKQGVFAAISAKVGSISDNQLGGWISYRASKAALNMALKTIALEWRRSMKKVCVTAIHPGTTDTRLSEPFQANVPVGKLFSPQQTATYISNIVEQLTPQQTGKFFSWDGAELPW